MELDNILDELDDVLSSAGSIPVLNYKLVKASDVDMILENCAGLYLLKSNGPMTCWKSKRISRKRPTRKLTRSSSRPGLKPTG